LIRYSIICLLLVGSLFAISPIATTDVVSPELINRIEPLNLLVNIDPPIGARLTSLREGDALVVDSSRNGYSFIASEINTIAANPFNRDQIVMAYRQYVEGAGSGQIAASISNDGGESWMTHSNINLADIGRYPSAIATSTYPIVFWNEYGGGGGDYDGRAYHAVNSGGYTGSDWSIPSDVDNDPFAHDNWMVNSVVTENETGDITFNTMATDWSLNNSKYLFWTTETSPWSGTPLQYSDSYLLLNPVDFLSVNEANYIANGKMDINAAGTGYFVTSAYWADPVQIKNHTLFIKKTDDYGATWSGWYHLPDEASNAYFDDVMPDSVYIEENDQWIYPGGGSPGIWAPFIGYDMEVLSDPNGQLHVWAPVLPSAEAGVYPYYSEANGIYHFSSSSSAFVGEAGPVIMDISFVASMQMGWSYDAPSWQDNVLSAAYDVVFPDALYLAYFSTTHLGINDLGQDYADMNILASYSLDGGGSWSEPENVTMTNDGVVDEVFPHMTRIAENGQIQLMYEIPDYSRPSIDPPGGPEDYVNLIYFQNYDFGLIVEIDTTATLRVATTESIPGTEIGLSISIELPPDSSITSLELDLSGFTQNLELMDVIPVATGAWSLEYALDSVGVLSIAAAGSDEISGSVILFDLLLSIPEGADIGFSAIEVIHALFDVDGMELDIVDGGVDIRPPVEYGDVNLSGYVSAYDAALILKHLVGYITLTDQQTANGDVSLDGSLSALDASIILQYLVHLLEELPVDSSAASLLASGNLDFDSPSLGLDSDYQVPLIIQSVENMFSMELELGYDLEQLNLDQVTLPEAMEHFTLEERTSENGSRVVLVSTVPISFDQEILLLNFSFVNGPIEDGAEISLAKYRLNEGDVAENVATTILFGTTSSADAIFPHRFELKQNYPNPFNPSTQIKFGLVEAGWTSIAIFDITGRQVYQQSRHWRAAGWHQFEWSPEMMKSRNIGAGVYLCIVDNGHKSFAIKMLYIR